MDLEKYSFGVGDRFAHQAAAQLDAIIEAGKSGLSIVPVWNKSNREHQITDSQPSDTRLAVEKAIIQKQWNGHYYVDADHINLTNVDKFIGYCNFYTIDVAEAISKARDKADYENFRSHCRQFIGSLQIPGIKEIFTISDNFIDQSALKYAGAVTEAINIYQYIAGKEGENNFIAEVSIDEADQPQSPLELLFILSFLAENNVKVQTIAPKFTGRFNKGVDYKGDINKFEFEFEEDLVILDYCIQQFGLPENLKLSIHSGSDKFSIYPIIGKLIRKHDKGIHVKTAGTTWLEEVIGLALSDGMGLSVAKEIYCRAYERLDELCLPYSAVIDIHKDNLPEPSEIKGWSSKKYVNTLRHEQTNVQYNPDFRQVLHVAYKIAAEMGNTYTDALDKYAENVGYCVKENLLERHIKRLFY
jgi:tagaturonate epimerase